MPKWLPILLLPLLFGLLGADSEGCGDTDEPADQCTATVAPNDPNYARFEGTHANNTCTDSSDCSVGGCSGEVCAAEQTFTTCDVTPTPSGNCGCLNGVCQWQVCQ